MTLKDLIDRAYREHPDPLNMDLFVWLHKDNCGYGDDVFDICVNGDSLQLCLKDIMRKCLKWEEVHDYVKEEFEVQLLSYDDEDLSKEAIAIKHGKKISNKGIDKYLDWLKNQWENGPM